MVFSFWYTQKKETSEKANNKLFPKQITKGTDKMGWHGAKYIHETNQWKQVSFNPGIILASIQMYGLKLQLQKKRKQGWLRWDIVESINMKDLSFLVTVWGYYCMAGWKWQIDNARSMPCGSQISDQGSKFPSFRTKKEQYQATLYLRSWELLAGEYILVILSCEK